jgi:predicted polyphosphate/ATP-dependent NAD kinase
MKVGLLVNPIAGMGGSVGLKGTDSNEVLQEARRRGAVPMAADRAADALRSAGDLEAYTFYTAGGEMGENVLKNLVDRMTVVYDPGRTTSDEDTRAAARALMDAGIEVLVFVGGDGTARDVMDAVGDRLVVIGVPSGVKMHSGVFANTPRDAGLVLRRFRVDGLPSRPAEVMDIDEAEFRQGRLSARLYGHMLTPEDPGLIQPFKLVLGGGTEDEHKEAIGRYMAENLRPGTAYILGPGTTMEVIGRELGIDKTLLGVDVLKDGEQIAKDADERTLLSILDGAEDARIVVTPIGAQGFIFGRGNQQISPRVIRRVGVRNVIVVATPLKMKDTKRLRVDTGDPALDEELRGYGKVVIGYGTQLMAPIE